ncbi:MAG: hypothetical protein R3A10_10275 [Caldilineaceae bacterium]
MQTDYGLANLVRKALMKKGGAAYVPPGPDTFPKVEQFHAFVIGSGGIPCATWLDGTSPGEQALPELLDLLIGKGAATFNIIPDRNWNIADPAAKEVKVRNLYAAVEMAADNALPILVGTEMNSPGQPLVDQFDAPELAPVRDLFLDGAHFLYGHTMLGRYGTFGYTSDWAAVTLTPVAPPTRFTLPWGAVCRPAHAASRSSRACRRIRRPKTSSRHCRQNKASHR